ncbi:P-loop NTPase fold protein [uncultured Chryseobacterium sp.]|uniref:KAP family P-loop NTPase fold protein n=1 Tax=uncultured Chryseobacterium sp. TaxID=259322 RepID=UPI0025DD3CE2|nr:P-loop NTPase fold protein [uncultured Chryseobacterium sp.]
MNIKHSDTEIDLEQPFKNCKLGREEYSSVLTNIIESYSDGFVLAINSKWGTGKTTFVKMWQQQLKNEEFETIYFNAWENDFEDNPLTALIGELQTITNSNDNKFKKIVKSAAKISKNIVPAIAKAILNKYLDAEIITEAIGESVKTAGEIFEEEVNEYAERKKSISDFRTDLEKFIRQETPDKPLIFIIDELDRCRPNYAVSLLEQVKHFFNVKNIIFILSIDKEQLGNAICGVYGSEKIDSTEYLKRFIDIEYSIPEPSSGKYFEYLYSYFDFDSFFNSTERMRYNDFLYDKENFNSICKILYRHCSLRQLEKMMSATRLALRTLHYNNYLIPTIFAFLIYIKFLYPKYYNNLRNKKISLLDMQSEFYEIIKSFLTEDNKSYFIEIEALLLVLFQNFISEFRSLDKIFINNKFTSENKLKIDSKINNQLLLQYYSNDHRDFSRIFNLDIGYFIKKIELTESFKL